MATYTPPLAGFSATWTELSRQAVQSSCEHMQQVASCLSLLEEHSSLHHCVASALLGMGCSSGAERLPLTCCSALRRRGRGGHLPSQVGAQHAQHGGALAVTDVIKHGLNVRIRHHSCMPESETVAAVQRSPAKAVPCKN